MLDMPKLRQYVIHYCAVLSVCGFMLLGVAGLADDLHLKDGRVIEAEEIWQVGDVVWYRQGKIIASVPRNEVVRITAPKQQPAAETKNRNVKAPQADSVQTGVVVTPPEQESQTRKVARIVLKDGSQIDADSIWEDSGRVAYRMGKMQSFVDRNEIKNIVREVVLTEAKIPADMGLRFSTGHQGLDQLIVYAATKYQVDPLLIYLVMREESGFNYRAVSRVGARGLMQLMPDTARRLGVRNIHDPIENVEAGTRYLRSLIDMFGGDMNLALAAYNAGEGAVLRYGRRVPPYAETTNYVWRINTAYRRALSEK